MNITPPVSVFFPSQTYGDPSSAQVKTNKGYISESNITIDITRVSVVVVVVFVVVVVVIDSNDKSCYRCLIYFPASV